MAKGKAAFSLRTADATDGGGIEGALATIGEIGFVDEFTYGGRQKDKPQAALYIKYEVEGFDKPWEQNYTLGPSEKYEVVNDGDGIRAVGKQTGLNRKCSAYAFFNALETAASESDVDLDEILPEEDGVHSVRPLEGRRVRLTNTKFETVGGDKKDLVVIGGFEEGEAAPAKGKSKGKSAKGGGNVEEKTEAAVVELFEDHPTIKKGDLGDYIYQEFRKDADVKAMMNLCLKDAWVASEDRPWEFNKKKGTLSMPDED